MILFRGIVDGGLYLETRMGCALYREGMAVVDVEGGGARGCGEGSGTGKALGCLCTEIVCW